MAEVANRQPTFVDAFAGCGGLSLGLLQAGMKGVFAIEKDKFAFASLKKNLLSENGKYKFSWPTWLPQKPISIQTMLTKHRDALEQISGSIDLLAGGPPCQGFSSAGRRKHNDPRNKLFARYVEIVDILKPRALLIENVRGFTIDYQTKRSVQNYAKNLRDLLENRYDVYEELIDLSQFGVPQKRTRYFLLAFQPGLVADNPFDALRMQLPNFLRALGLRVPMSSKSALSDLEIARGGTKPSVETDGFQEIKYVKPLTSYQKFMAQNSATPNNLRLARHSSEIVARFEEIIDHSHAEGRLNTTISEELRSRFGLRKRALRVLDPDQPSPTITSMPDDLLHYKEPRTLTVRENARLQAFPDWFTFEGKYTTGGDLRRKEVPRFTQVANAVPPLVARAFGEMLLPVLASPQASSASKKRPRG